MNKSIKIALGLITGLLVIIFLAITLTLDSYVKSNIEKTGSELTGTSVTVGGVSISPFSGKGVIKNLRVANPDGFNEDYAFQADEISIELDVWSLLSDKMIIHRVSVSSPLVYIEQKLPENNLRTILSNIRAVSAGQTSDAEFILEHFLMTDGRADLYTEVGGERSATFQISQIELQNPGEGIGGSEVESAIQEIAEEIIRNALSAAAREGTDQLRDAIEGIFN
jgi:uncharacterized protein involved in outer membrane biogenesis